MKTVPIIVQSRPKRFGAATRQTRISKHPVGTGQ